MKTVRIFYMRPEWFRDGIFGTKPDIAALDKTHVELMTIYARDDETDLLNRIFRSCQGEVWSPHGEARELIESKGLEHTSMSIGDVIVVDGEAHMVAPVGFASLGRVTG